MRWKTRIGLGALAVAVGLLGVGVAEVEAQIQAPAVNSVGPAGQMKLFVTWSWASADGGTNTGAEWVASKFEVRYEQVDAPGNAFTGVGDEIVDAGAGARSFTLEGLKPNKRYLVAIRAHGSYTGTDADDSATGDGVSAWSAVSNDTSGTTLSVPQPDVVEDLVLVERDGAIDASWDAADGNGVDITGYEVQIKPDGGAWTNHAHFGTGTSTTIGGLMNGTEYSVRVRALNGYDWGDADGWSDVEKATPMAADEEDTEEPEDGEDGEDGDDEEEPPTPTEDDGTPNAPMLKPATSTNTTITLSWNEPGSGDAPIIDYQIEYMMAGGTAMPLMETEEMMVTITGLTASTEYHVRVRARNRIGYGAWTDYVAVTTKAKAAGPTGGPVKMAEPTVVEGDMMLTVSWMEPASDRSITHYDVRYKTASATTWMPEKPMSVTAMHVELTGLVNGTAYLVQVRAVDSAGAMGPWSDSASGTPMMPTPALPVFGAIALAGALAAAGRRRMRQRQLASAKLRYLPKK